MRAAAQTSPPEPGMSVYERIRANCCPEHGLGGITGQKDQPRDDPQLLDDHAAQITQTVLRAKAAA